MPRRAERAARQIECDARVSHGRGERYRLSHPAEAMI